MMETESIVAVTAPNVDEDENAENNNVILSNESHIDAEQKSDHIATSAEPVRKSTAYIVIKRIFDFVFSLFLGIVTLVPMTVVALLIVIRDPGNPFYLHKRVGKGGKPIYIAKLRTMRKGADDIENALTPKQLEEYRREYKLDDDPRLIGYKKAGDGKKCFGARLRQMSIDELPQILWNICIIGDMSVVGPRPILQDEIEQNYLPEQRELLLSVKPGLTGYWQAYARNEATYKDGKRQQMELYYVNNASFRLDVKVLFATVGAIISKSGAK